MFKLVSRAWPHRGAQQTPCKDQPPLPPKPTTPTPEYRQVYSACQSLPFHISGNPQLLPTESALAVPSLCWAAPAPRRGPLPVRVERHTCACPALVSGSAGQGQSSQPSCQTALTPLGQCGQGVPRAFSARKAPELPLTELEKEVRGLLVLLHVVGGGMRPDPTKESFPKISPCIPQTHLILSVEGKSF